MDATNLEFSDHSFDAVIDKGYVHLLLPLNTLYSTMDSILVNFRFFTQTHSHSEVSRQFGH
jgi:hypothetical protein